MVVKQIVIWLFLVLAEMVLLAVFISPEYAMKQINDERLSVYETLGSEQLKTIDERTERMYGQYIIDWGVRDWVYEIYMPKYMTQKSANHEKNEEFRGVMSKRLEGLFRSIYSLVQRISILAAWTPFALLILLPSLIDGYNKRKIKTYTYGYTSPVRYSAAYQLTIGAFMVLPAYVALPVTLPAWLPMIWAIFTGLTMNLLFSNIQKQL